MKKYQLLFHSPVMDRRLVSAESITASGTRPSFDDEFDTYLDAEQEARKRCEFFKDPRAMYFIVDLGKVVTVQWIKPTDARVEVLQGGGWKDETR